jgi:hypothetical protein
MVYYILNRGYEEKEMFKRLCSERASMITKNTQPKVPQRLDTKISLLTAPAEYTRNKSIASDRSEDRSGLMPPNDDFRLTSTQKKRSNQNGIISFS